jgi:cytolysin-activating lysine-acyltransferase
LFRDPPATTLNRWREFGAAITLDLVASPNLLSSTICTYFNSFAQPVEKGHIYVACDDDSRPMWHATWTESLNKSANAGAYVSPLRICNPFSEMGAETSSSLHLSGQDSIEGFFSEPTRNGLSEKLRSFQPRDDKYFSISASIFLLSASKYHQKFETGYYMNVEVVPPLRANQAKFYFLESGFPVAFATWAWLNDAVLSEIVQTGRALYENEWNCGDKLFFNDWVAPFGHTRQVMFDMTHNAFPDHEAYSLRRNADGSVKKVSRLFGENYLKRSEIETKGLALKGT